MANLSGSNTETGYVEGAAAVARFHNPTHPVLDASGNVYVLDNGRYLRRVAPDGTSSLWVDLTAYVWAEDDYHGGVWAYTGLTSLATDGTNLYVFANRRIFKISPDRTVTLLAGTLTTPNGVAEDGTGAGASFTTECVIAASSDGYVYLHSGESWVDETRQQRYGAVRLVSPAGVARMIAHPGSGAGVKQVAVVGTDLYSIGRNWLDGDAGWNKVMKTTRDGACTLFAAIPATLASVTHLTADPNGHLAWAGYDAAGWNLCFGSLSATGVWSTLWTDTGQDGYSLAQRQAADPDPTKPVRVCVRTQDGEGVISVPAWTPPFVMG